MFLPSRAGGCASRLGCRSGLHCSGSSGRLWKRAVCRGSPHTHDTRSAAPASGGKVLASAGPARFTRGWESRKFGRGSPSLCSAHWSCVSLRLAPSACGLAWGPTRLCCSRPAKFSSPFEPQARRQREREEGHSEPGSGLTAFCTCALLSLARIAHADCTRRECQDAFLSHSPGAVGSVHLSFFFGHLAGLQFHCQPVAENQVRVYFESGVWNTSQVTGVRRGRILFPVLSPELSSWRCSGVLEWILMLL